VTNDSFDAMNSVLVELPNTRAVQNSRQVIVFIVKNLRDGGCRDGCLTVKN